MSVFIEEICPKGLLSFGPSAEPIKLTSLNVLIGPNGSGKSNLLEIFNLLRAAPEDIASVFRQGGGATEWLWKGPRHASNNVHPGLETILNVPTKGGKLRHRLEFAASQSRMEIIDEAIERTRPKTSSAKDVYFYYRFNRGNPTINAFGEANSKGNSRQLRSDSVNPFSSILSQRRDSDIYPEITMLAQMLGNITIYNEWAFGRRNPIRGPQRADLPTDHLLPTGENLALVLNQKQFSDTWQRFQNAAKNFLPGFSGIKTSIEGGTIQLFLSEIGKTTPIPATRLSDGTVRFLMLAAILTDAKPPPLICLDEPEMGMHPDAISILAGLLVDASERTQLVVTTHSDVLISHLSEKVNSVLVCEQLQNGTQFTRLESEKLQHWLDRYKLGEIWRLGEIGGNP
jgi:predicted ATPase